MVGSRRFTSAGGVDRTTPNPSGRRGSGMPPSTQGGTGAGTAVIACCLAGAREAAAGVCWTAGVCWKAVPQPASKAPASSQIRYPLRMSRQGR
jgi:hypothetical protein